MKRMRRISVLLAALLAMTMLGGCGGFDASGYIKALLDNSYKNDSAAFVEQKVGTKEQAEELYNQGIDSEIKSLTSQVDLSDELQEQFKTVIQDVYKSVKYTVGEAKKDGDNYVVEVKYQKMNVFAPAMEKFNKASQDYIAEMTEKAQNGEETPSDDEMNEVIYEMLKDAIQESLAEVQYADEASTTVRVELSGKVYTPNQEDVENLEYALFDIEAVTDAK